ncbi:DEAD/DEAH box helicase family protein [Leucothrix arctica]|uniref:DEAD/DEAH box helicase family protein n=1 Tax=Leucothrix arctica TaxID=1481894 RepID=UPI001BABB466|nr:DEAD/DEAH box helicase family protein [Leucothrix arctica]
MDSKEKKTLSESDIKAKFITPALVKAGWDEMTQIRREVTLTPGPVIVRGNLSSRNKKKKKFADYVLQKEKGVPVAVVEAKENNKTISDGMQQALGYADILEVPSVYSSNGDGFASHNKFPLQSENIEIELSMDEFPSPEILWERYKSYRGIEDEHESLVTQPYFDDGSGKEPRYYQAEAINRVIEKVSKGEKRLLLVMATGTGKTYTTFQIIWRLWKAKRVKRVLFLVDRNILADQTQVNDFKPFGSVMTKIKNRKIDPAYEIYLGLYQGLTGPEEKDKRIHAEMSGRPIFSLFDFDQAYNHWNRLNGDTLQDDPDAGMLKKWENKDGDTSYAFMLPIPKNDVIHRQVYRDYQIKTTFWGSSNCAIEYLFYGAVNQGTYFKTEPSPGGEQVKFDGDKTSF